MIYEVVLTTQARHDLCSAADAIATHSPAASIRWLETFLAKLRSLSRHPLRCGLAGEDERSIYELRQLLVGRRRTYRAIFTVVPSRVIVLTIRHASQDEWDPSDLDID